MCGFWLVLKDRIGSLIYESNVITLYSQPGYVIITLTYQQDFPIL